MRLLRTKHERRVIASETEGIADHIIQLHAFAAQGRSDASLNAVLPAQIAGYEPVLHSQKADDGLNGSGCGSCVSGKGFGAGYCRHCCSEYSLQGAAFGYVVVRSACAVSIDILNVRSLQSRHIQSVSHRKKGTLPVFGSGSLVEGIATVAVTAYIC